MGKLKNEQHEAFAQAKADGKTNGEAYRAAGWTGKGSTCTTYGCVIANKPEVAARSREIQIQKVKDRPRDPVCIEGVDKLWVMSQLIYCYEIAINAVPVRFRGQEVEGVYRVDLPSAQQILHKIGLENDMFEKKVRVVHEKMHLIEGGFHEMVARVVKLIRALGPQVEVEIVKQLGYTGERASVGSLGAGDFGAGEDGVAEPLLLSASSEAS